MPLSVPILTAYETMDDLNMCEKRKTRPEQRSFEAFGDVAATNRTCAIVFEPFVDTFGVEHVVARKRANALPLLEVRLTDDAHRLLVRVGPTEAVTRQLVDLVFGHALWLFEILLRHPFCHLHQGVLIFPQSNGRLVHLRHHLDDEFGRIGRRSNHRNGGSAIH